MRKIALSLIKFYQNRISADSGGVLRYLGFARVCRFNPTCSEYAYQAVKRYGIIKGLFLGLARISRCHPWGKSGFDPLK